MAKELLATKPLADLLAWERFPGEEVVTDTDLDGYIRSSVHSANAVVGTCR